MNVNDSVLKCTGVFLSQFYYAFVDPNFDNEFEIFVYEIVACFP